MKAKDIESAIVAGVPLAMRPKREARASVPLTGVRKHGATIGPDEFRARYFGHPPPLRATRPPAAGQFIPLSLARLVGMLEAAS
jgi:hypothetical protein